MPRRSARRWRSSCRGLVGFCSERVRDSAAGRSADDLWLAGRPDDGRRRRRRPARNGGEAGLLHFRGAFHDPFMVLPVTLPPIGAALLATAAAGPVEAAASVHAAGGCGCSPRMGFAGVGFHAYGVSRNMGGWRNWSQNILNGPPLPAPPSFAGLALAGLAALRPDEGPSRCVIRRKNSQRDRYPGYDVLSKRDSPSWNDKTREVIDAPSGDRIASRSSSRADEFLTVNAIATASCRSRRTDRRFRSPALSTTRLHERTVRWLSARRHAAGGRGLAARSQALDAEAKAAHGNAFTAAESDQDACWRACRKATEVRGVGRHAVRAIFSARAWRATSFSPITRIPTAWSEIGWGGPAARAAMCAWISTSAIPGKPPKSRTATTSTARRNNRRVR